MGAESRVPVGKLTRAVRLCLLAMVPALVLAAVYTSFLIVQRQQALGEVSRYNVTWLVSQASLEVARLHGTAAMALLPGGAEREQEVQLRLDVVANRTRLFEGGDIAGFVATSPQLSKVVAMFRDAVRAGQYAMDTSTSPERLRRVLTLAEALNAPMARLSAAANSYGGDLVSQDQGQLSRLHWLFAAILGALTTCAFGLIGVLTWHNRLLARASERAEQQNQVLEHRDREVMSQTARIFYMAHHDALTGLPNRLLFQQQLEAVLDHRKRRGDGVALLCLDLDYFKQVNDTLGHPAGDTLLKEVATRLLGCVRDGDVVARLGGDEFAILQCGTKESEQAAELAQKIVEVLSARYHLDGDHAIIGVSIGIALANAGSCTADLLLRNADLALYKAKEGGRGAFRFFEYAMDEQVQARRSLQLDLHEALARDEFEVVYQPLLHLKRERISGFEALLRWRHPERGLVSPGEFIAMTEELGLIVPIGEWVMARACAEAATWPEHIKVAVNLSPIQFRNPGLLDAVSRALESSGLPACRLELEVTESVLLQDSEAVLTTLHSLRALGCHVALDDFGTGYSSLSYLRNFPFSKIKIDKSFVQDMVERADCRTIIASVFSLASDLGMTTTAEGVETKEQLELLQRTGCTEIQGYLFDRPRPATDIRHWFLPGADQAGRYGRLWDTQSTSG